MIVLLNLWILQAWIPWVPDSLGGSARCPLATGKRGLRVVLVGVGAGDHRGVVRGGEPRMLGLEFPEACKNSELDADLEGVFVAAVVDDAGLDRVSLPTAALVDDTGLARFFGATGAGSLALSSPPQRDMNLGRN